MTACLFLIGGLVVSLEPVIIRYCTTAPPPVNEVDNYIDHGRRLSNKPNNETGIVDTSETGSLLVVDGNEDDFTSSRISRTYTPYDKGTRFKSEDVTSPAPLANKNEI
jgi:hypothetical protein